jgi:hypothetical protein
MPRKTRKSSIRKKTALPDAKGMIATLKAVYGPSQLREIAAGLGLEKCNPACSGCKYSQDSSREE